MLLAMAETVAHYQWLPLDTLRGVLLHMTSMCPALPLDALQATLSKLGALAAGAAIFLGGYTTGIASSNMLGDVRSAEMHRQELSAPAPASLPVKPVSLALPDQVGSSSCSTSSSSCSGSSRGCTSHNCTEQLRAG
jgi:hypothetical protein